MGKTIIFLFVVKYLTTTAFAGAQVHRVYGLNPDTVTNCEAMVKEIASKIQRDQGVPVAASFCEQSSSTGRITGLISYSADEPLTEISTYTLGATYAAKGIYPSRGYCEEMLQREITIFETNTDLSATYAFCSREPLNSKNPWYPYITAFGIAKKVPFRSSWRSDRPYGTDTTIIRDALEQHFSDREARFIHLVYRNTGASGELTAFYYTPQEHTPLEIYDSVAASIPGLEACNSTAARIIAEGTQINERQVILSYCTSGYSNPTKFELVLVHEGMEFLDSIQHNQSFSSIQSCELSRSSIEGELRTVYGEKIITTVCGHPRFSLSRGAPYFVIAAKRY